ncbi:hypothetical protein AB6A40_007999 [Gnathostoma spinigerum]|uniref:Gluconokinase n=1 Tax=Gnathostoma spinigerum TaxID=75299 RepID=A0ABD6EMU7_9BILA
MGSLNSPEIGKLKCIFMMGVAGCGKTTIGIRLASLIHGDFIDADWYHSKKAKEKMSKGIPLNDEDRQIWLEELAEIAAAASKRTVIACSALKITYRRILTKKLKTDEYIFIHLNVPKSELERRLTARIDHFFNPELLQSQLQTLEAPLECERCCVIDANSSKDEVLSRVLNFVEKLL